jgi:hypothetical protein
MTAFAAPASNEGANVKPADLLGHLLIISPVEYKTGIQTSLGETDAIEVNIVDLDTSEEHTSVLFFNVALKSALKPNIGKQVLARIGQGVAKPGKSAPWILVNATDDPTAVAKATSYIASGFASTPAVASAQAVAPAVDPNSPEIQALLAKLGAKAV